jgi:16S rRNA (cytidine1402-2'-O)-methyltransferase
LQHRPRAIGSGRLHPMKSPEPASNSSQSTLPPGPTLYLVATPIGNLEDITLRALRVLKEVDLIACEDTRQTQKLLNHYGITTRTISYHEHNEMTRAAELIVDLEQGTRIAMVSDAGMPGISDPGFRLITLAIRHHVPVIPIPGATAFLAALVASGLPSDSFRFSGFLPAKAGQRRSLLESIKHSPRTQVFYEAPHRLLETLKDTVEMLGPDRHVVIAREVTKVHEEFLRGRAGAILEQLQSRGEIKGEITLIIAKPDQPAAKLAPTRSSVRQRVEEIMSQDKMDEKSALKKLAKEMGVSKSEAYRELQRSK